MNQKIRAYTLLEITVAMLLSGICITVCYTAYSLIRNYYQTFHQQQEQIDAVLSLKHTLQHDFLQSKICKKTAEAVLIESDSTIISYSFDANFVTRKLNEQHTDTFKLISIDVHGYFENEEVDPTDTIDRLSFRIKLLKKESMAIEIKKLYSAENLFH